MLFSTEVLKHDVLWRVETVELDEARLLGWVSILDELDNQSKLFVANLVVWVRSHNCVMREMCFYRGFYLKLS